MCLFCFSLARLSNDGQDAASPPSSADVPSADAYFLAQRRQFLRRASVAAAAGGWGWLAPGSAQAQVNVGKASSWRKLVSAEQVEAAASQQYAQLIGKARSQQALVGSKDAQYQMLQRIARRMVPHTPRWNERANGWRWQVNLIRSQQVNAFCMPGGKIAFFTGMLNTIKLSQDEAAVVMGHEMAHALREHSREQIAKSGATRMGASLLSQALGLGSVGNAALGVGAQLLEMRYSRSDESEADIVGLELSARAGYDPNAALTLWQKMGAAKGQAGMEFLSSHPSDQRRMQQLGENIPKVMGLYQQARRAG